MYRPEQFKSAQQMFLEKNKYICIYICVYLKVQYLRITLITERWHEKNYVKDISTEVSMLTNEPWPSQKPAYTHNTYCTFE